MHLRNRPASTIKESEKRISSLYQMKFISCNEQHDTFLLAQLKTKGLGSFSEKKISVFCNPTKGMGKYRRHSCHIIRACKYTEHVNVAPGFSTYIPELPISILEWGKTKARKCWESCPTSLTADSIQVVTYQSLYRRYHVII